MKILLIAGHGAGDPGAGGNGYSEADLVREIVPSIKQHLGNKADVTIYPMERNAYADRFDYLQTFIRNGGYDYVLEVHLNSGGDPYGTGTEIFITSLEDYATVEAEVMNRLGEIYPPKRGGTGVKVFDWGVIRTIKNMGVSSALVECFFINNPNEVNKYLSDKKATAKSIADGIIKGFELGEVEETVKPAPQPDKLKPSKNDEEVALDVIAGLYGNGGDRKKNLKEDGYDYDKVQAIVDRIIAEKESAADQILHIGEKCVFNGNHIVEAVDVANDWILNSEIGGWFSATICEKIGSNQILSVGDRFNIPGIYTVGNVNAPSDLVYLTELGFWVKASALTEV